MRLDWTLLANHAEVSQGLLYVAGGGWDTVNVTGPPPETASPGTVAVLQGTLVVRLLFHATETDREHTFTITLIDADGSEEAKIEGTVDVARVPEIPPGWDHGVNLALPLTGMPVRTFGLYTFSVQVDGQHVGDRPFRVIENG